MTRTQDLQSSSSLVAILLCTYNGEKFLAQQLDSLEAQTYTDWVVMVSDDGSSDRTIEILEHYQSKWPVGKLTIRRGPQKGFCQNFLSLACDPTILASYYAFCDQDDVWLPQKLAVAVHTIVENQNIETPFLYGGRTQYVNEQLKPYGMSPLFIFPPGFRNALVQSIAGGNTMVFNFPAKVLIEKAGPVQVPLHDWWVYQLISGADGDVLYDPIPTLLYRQHKDALVGGNRSFFSNIQRAYSLVSGNFRNSNDQYVQALKELKPLLGRQNQKILKLFETLRNADLKDRFRLMEICGLYRQTRKGTFSLFLAILFKRV